VMSGAPAAVGLVVARNLVLVAALVGAARACRRPAVPAR
jgi:hypothetical protein